MTDDAFLARYLAPAVRLEIEHRFWEPINARARLESATRDPVFLADPETYAPFFSDHGVVHARDVAGQVLRVLETSHGVLIPAREPLRLDFMRSYAVLLAYLHDVGMVDFTQFGRAMHPERAAQMVFSVAFDAIAEQLSRAELGLGAHLRRLAESGLLPGTGATVLREMLALCSAHSKSKVPVEILNDPLRLREIAQEQCSTDLHVLHRRQLLAQARRAAAGASKYGTRQETVGLESAVREAEAALAETEAGASASQRELALNLQRLYPNFARDAFAWLVPSGAGSARLIGDVLDTLRALRCGDALRQRGAVLRTSGGYEMFIDRRSANVLYALRREPDRLYLLEMPEPLPSGEANISASELTGDGNVRIAFHRGSFAGPEATRRAAYCAALVVKDIQSDAVDSFRRPRGLDAAGAAPKTVDEIEILLEGVDDNPDFAELVRHELESLGPEAWARARCVPSLQNIAPDELQRYLAAAEPAWDVARRVEVLGRIAESGHKTAGIDLVRGFRDARLVTLSPGELLVEAGAPAGFVYVPLDPGLKVIPLGGYPPFPADAWMPLGVTGVIRGAERNATVQAEGEVRVLILPKELYLREWHATYSAEELRAVLCEALPL